MQLKKKNVFIIFNIFSTVVNEAKCHTSPVAITFDIIYITTKE